MDHLTVNWTGFIWVLILMGWAYIAGRSSGAKSERLSAMRGALQDAEYATRRAKMEIARRNSPPVLTVSVEKAMAACGEHLTIQLAQQPNDIYSRSLMRFVSEDLRQCLTEAEETGFGCVLDCSNETWILDGGLERFLKKILNASGFDIAFTDSDDLPMCKIFFTVRGEKATQE
jgi:hypothetical protein